MAVNKKFELETPCWIFKPDQVLKNLADFSRSFHETGYSFKIAYSLKTNPLPQLIDILYTGGCMIEVVSYDEWRLTTERGIATDRIIYNGPLKDKATFNEALRKGAIVNIETKRELEWLKELAHKDSENQSINIGLRISVNLSEVYPKDAEGSNDYSRFGFSATNGELEAVLNELAGLHNVNLSGIHLHRTTRRRHTDYYRAVANYAADIIEKFQLKLRYIDFGGGFHYQAPGQPSYKNYADAITNTLRRRGIEDLEVIIEPGNALVGNAFNFMCEVIDVKEISSDERIVIVDGSRKDIDPLFHNRNYKIQRLACQPAEPRSVMLQTIAGCTCMEYDRITKMDNSPEFKTGDRIIFTETGAYTMAFASEFIRKPAKVYTFHKGKFFANEHLMNI